MLKSPRLVGLLVGACLLSGCATTSSGPKFYWGTYEHSLYVYSKKPDQREEYRSSLEKAIEQGRTTNSMAPGLLAELGYLYLEDGDSDKAITLFQEEMTRFPESKVFLTAVVEHAKANPPAKKGQS
jgi:hypothetical protein